MTIFRRKPPDRISSATGLKACAATLKASRHEWRCVRLFGRRVRCLDEMTGNLILCRRWRGRLYFDRCLEENHDGK